MKILNPILELVNGIGSIQAPEIFDHLIGALIENLYLESSTSDKTEELFQLLVSKNMYKSAIVLYRNQRLIQPAVSRKTSLYLLKVAAQKGDWEIHNDFLAFCIETSLINPTLQIYLQTLCNLDFKNAERIYAKLHDNLDPAETVLASFVLSLAHRKYSKALTLFKLNPKGLLMKLNANNNLHWFYLLILNSDKEVARNVLQFVISEPTENYSIEILTYIAKVSIVHNWKDLQSELIVDLSESLSYETLRTNLIFARCIIFICQKLNIKPRVLSFTLASENNIFSKEELGAITLKQRLIQDGPAILETDSSINIATSGQTYLEIPLIVYGRDYCNALRDFLVSSMLTSKDFRSLPEEYDAHITVCTTDLERDLVIEVLKPLQELGFKISVPQDSVYNIETIKHFRMWFIVQRLHKVESRKGVYIMLCPDSVFGEGLKSLITKCPDGGGAGGILIRCSWSKMYLSRKDGSLLKALKSSDRNRALMYLAAKKWRHYCHRLYEENISPNFVRITREGKKFNNWMGVPNVIKPRDGFVKKLIENSTYRYSNVFGDHVGQYIDHELINNLIDDNKLYLVKSAQEFCFIEMASDSGYSQLWKSLPDLGYGDKAGYSEVFID
jgi:hypothetical protein